MVTQHSRVVILCKSFVPTEARYPLQCGSHTWQCIVQYIWEFLLDVAPEHFLGGPLSWISISGEPITMGRKKRGRGMLARGKIKAWDGRWNRLPEFLIRRMWAEHGMFILNCRYQTNGNEGEKRKKKDMLDFSFTNNMYNTPSTAIPFWGDPPQGPSIYGARPRVHA